MPELHEGDTLGSYVLERAIDRGAFGRVWRARDAQSGRTVAIKVLAAEGADETRARTRTDLERLAAAAARDSRHIVHVLSSGHDPVPHIVMEFVDGTNLRDELAARGPLPQEEVMRIGREIADALAALHRVRIVHRDVKPANILLDHQGEVRLTDFGIAKILGYDDTVTLTQQNLLSAPYAAPEVWEGAPNPASDLYAFGAVLFEMLAGRPPFQGSLVDLFRQHRSDEADFSLLPAHTAPSLRELIYECLRKPAAERPANAEACIRMLDRAAQELRREPEHFGPWVRLEHDPDQPWTWRCRHDKTDEEALVEVHFAQDEAYGEALRAAVSVNQKLTPLGAEKLLGTNRLLLSDDEGWPGAPEHNLVFWVARKPAELPDPAGELDVEQLRRAADTSIRMIEAASSAGVRLAFDSDRTVVLADGAVHLRRPGLPPRAPVEPRLGAFIFLRSLPLTPEAAAVAARSRDLRDLREKLSRPGGVASAPSTSEGRRLGWPILLGLGALGIAIVAVLAAFVFTGRGDGRAGVMTTVGPVVLPQCGEVTLPVPLAAAREACSGATSVSLQMSVDCPRGQVCAVASSGTGVVLHANDQTIAFVDGNGDLTLARESDFTTTRLIQDGRIREPAWSPDGRYLAYIVMKSTADATTTELWVLDTKDLASSANIFTSSDAAAAPEWARRHISQPRWGADGRTLYFLWKPAAGPDEVWSIEMPLRNGGLDIRQLRVWSGTPRNLASARAEGLDANTTRYESISALADGSLLVEFCSTKDGACGLARWDTEAFSVIVPPTRNARFIAPVQRGDHVLALTPDGPDAILVEIDPGGAIMPVARLPASVAAGEADSTQLSISLSPDGTRALVATAAGLRMVTLEDGRDSPLVEGRWAVWYSPVEPAPSLSSPPAAPFETPGPTPSPAAASPIPTGEADLTGEVVPGTCAIGQVLAIKIRNLGPFALDRDVFIRVSTANGTVQGLTNVGLVGLAPGREVEVRTNYTVQEAAQVVIEYTRDRQNENNIVSCTPR